MKSFTLRFLESLRCYFEEVAASGESHPFVTEALADYTRETTEAIRLYRLALSQSKGFPNEPLHTKMISLAERLIELGEREEAEAYLRDGRAEACRRADEFWVHAADKLSQRLE